MSKPPPNVTSKRSVSLQRYWKSNVTIMFILMTIWAIVGLGCGVLFADALNAYQLGGIPLGFWFAQQGSIIVFVVLILIYATLLNQLDKKHHTELEQIAATESNSGVSQATNHQLAHQDQTQAESPSIQPQAANPQSAHDSDMNGNNIDANDTTSKGGDQ